MEASNLSQTIAGTSKVKNGRACAIDFIRVLLPAHERHLLLQSLSFDSSLSIKKLKSLVLLLEEVNHPSTKCPLGASSFVIHA